MKGLSRIRGGRPAGDEPAQEPQPPAADPSAPESAAAPSAAGASEGEATAAFPLPREDGATAVHPAVPPPTAPAAANPPPAPAAGAVPQPAVAVPGTAAPAPPAGIDPQDLRDRRPSFRDRGRLRRRLRYLRRVRELGFRDLGGLAFDLHRFGRRGDELIRAKLQALDAVDRELRAIEHVLDDHRDIVELREPGIAACPRCGALHGTEARFCHACGQQFSGPIAIGDLAAPVTGQAAPAAAPVTGSHAAAATAPGTGAHAAQAPPATPASPQPFRTPG